MDYKKLSRIADSMKIEDARLSKARIESRWNALRKLILNSKKGDVIDTGSGEVTIYGRHCKDFEKTDPEYKQFGFGFESYNSGTEDWSTVEWVDEDPSERALILVKNFYED